MPEILVKAEISDRHLRAYRAEAERRGVSVEDLVQQTVNCLLRELEAEQEECREVGAGS